MSEARPLVEAPAQERIPPIPDNANDFFKNPNFLKIWDDKAKGPTTYDPPQLKPGYIPWYYCVCINWWQQRSPLFAEPVVPCCCARGVYSCCVKPDAYLPVDDPDEWMVRMLSTGTSPECPPEMQGLYWMQDNIAAHEQLVTFHDADWVSNNLGVKTLQYNWTRGPTMFGAGLFAFIKLKGNTLRMEFSPNKKWLSIGGSSGNPTWIYCPEEGEEFALPGGGYLRPSPGDKMRISYEEDWDPNTAVTYQYQVRKIAYLDEQGKLVKTPAYHELAKRATEPMKYDPTCCGYIWCLSEDERALKNLPYLPSRTVVRYAPPPPGAVFPPGVPGR